jgi:hypothetical protein
MKIGAFFILVRPAGRTCLMVRWSDPSSPLHTRQGEMLAGRQGCPP